MPEQVFFDQGDRRDACQLPEGFRHALHLPGQSVLKLGVLPNSPPDQHILACELEVRAHNPVFEVGSGFELRQSHGESELVLVLLDETRKNKPLHHLGQARLLKHLVRALCASDSLALEPGNRHASIGGPHHLQHRAVGFLDEKVLWP